MYRRIVEQGEYKVFNSYPIKSEFVSFIETELVSIIESFDKLAADAVRRDGLTSMHLYVSPDKVIELQDKLSERIKVRMLGYSARVAREVLNMGEDFYLDLMVISRIKFPFDIARKSTLSYMDYSKYRGRTNFTKPPEMTSGYHNNLPFPAWCHGTHADSWFGHSFDGINLWWGVAGVTKESGMTFYPDYIGSNTYPLHEEPPYLAKEFPLPKPTFFDLDPGDLIAFNSDTLHGTRVNHSPYTRVSISTRLNPKRPRFSPHQFRHVKLWVHSSNLKAFTEASVHGVPSIEDSHRIHGSSQSPLDEFIFVAPKEDSGNGNTCKKTLPLEVQVIEALGNRVNVDLPVGKKVLVKLSGRDVVLSRTTKGLRAVSARCPHVGYNLAYGGHDDDSIYCPGHGLAFDWNTGESACGFRVRTLSVHEDSDGIYITDPRNKQN